MYLFLAVMILLIFLEQRFPAGERAGWKDYFNTTAIFAISIIFMVTTGLGGAAATLSSWTGGWLGLPQFSPSGAFIVTGLGWFDQSVEVFLIAFFVLFFHDAWLYFSHRLEHKFSVLWAFHKVHHSEERMNIMTSGRDHFMQTVWRSFFSLLTIGLFVDLDFKQAADIAGLTNLFLMIWSMFYHSNTRIELPWLNKILVTPQVHRIHHSTMPEHQDKNFADIFPIFDIVGGTYLAPKRGEFPETGLSSGEKHANLWQALVAPFTSWWQLLRRSSGKEC